MSDQNQSVTKDDVEEIVGRVVGDIVGDALQLISGRFDNVEDRLTKVEDRLKSVEDTQEVHTGKLNNIENKVNASVARLDDHGDAIELLKRAA